MKRNRAHSVEEATHKKLKQLVFCLYLYSEHTYITQIHECSGFGMIRGVASVFARKCFSIDLSNVNNNLHPTNTHTHTYSPSTDESAPSLSFGLRLRYTSAKSVTR